MPLFEFLQFSIIPALMKPKSPIRNQLKSITPSTSIRRISQRISFFQPPHKKYHFPSSHLPLPFSKPKHPKSLSHPCIIVARTQQKAATATATAPIDAAAACIRAGETHHCVMRDATSRPARGAFINAGSITFPRVSGLSNGHTGAPRLHLRTRLSGREHAPAPRCMQRHCTEGRGYSTVLAWV